LSFFIAARHEARERMRPSYRRYIGTAITVWKAACGGVSIGNGLLQRLK
jgi:hypothetical protein